MLRWTEPHIGDSIVDVALSISEQTDRLYNDKVMLASYSDVKATLKNFDQIGDKLDEIELYVKKMKGHPGEYLRSMTKAFRCFTRNLQGDKIPYNILISDIQELPIEIISDEKAAGLRENVERGLAELGYKGDFKEKVNSWLTETRIKPDQVTKVAEKFISLGKKGTIERVIDLPKEDGIDEVKAIRDVFWSGYSRYLGNYRGDLTFNIDRTWSEPTFAQVVTHESYPGHQTFYCRWDYLYKHNLLPIEASYYFVNSPTNALFEGGPETALHFLGWDDEDDDSAEVAKEVKKRYAIARDFLDFQRIAQTNACILTNLHNASKEEALIYMENLGMMNELEAKNTYRFFTHPIQKTYYPSYYYGRWMIGKAYDMVSKEQRPAYFKTLYDTPHTTNTFINSIKNLTCKDFNPFLD